MKIKINYFLVLITTYLLSINSTYAINFPNDLSWSTMPEITFNYPTKTGTAKQKELIRQIWGKKLQNKDTAFVLLATSNTKDNIYHFSILNSERSGCIAPPNGDGTNNKQDTFSMCSIRISQQNKITKETKIQDIPNYCYLNLDDEPGELIKNHTEFSYDDKSKIAYFRTIMYGKHIPTCDRAIRLK
jgi:hypothetical protein